MQQLYPVSAPVRDPLRIYDDVRFPPVSDPQGRQRPYTVVNMVSTVDGKTTLDLNRNRHPIGSRLDRSLMSRLRAAVDAVMRGAETVRRDPYYPKAAEDLESARRDRGWPGQPLAVVVSGSCDLPVGSPYFQQAPRRPLVLTTAQAPRERVEEVRKVADVIVMGEARVDIPAALAFLRERYGVRYLLCEGGPALNYELLQGRLLDEIFWTVAPKLSGFEADLTMVRGPRLLEPLPRLELVSGYVHESELFLRYRVAAY